jgi:hypothetical protein
MILMSFLVLSSSVFSNNKVINGIELSERELPAVIHFNGRCTATFISQRVFITSAHCIMKKEEDVLGVKTTLFQHPKFNFKYFRKGPRRGFPKLFDIAIGIMDSVVNLNIRPLSVCNKKLVVADKTTLVGYGCNKIRRQQGIGVKRFGHSWVKSIKNVLLTTDIRKTGGLSCPEDSGAPYLLHEKEGTLCIASINFYSDRKKHNYSAQLAHPDIQDWMKALLKEKELEVCGVNKVCEKQLIPNLFQY